MAQRPSLVLGIIAGIVAVLAVVVGIGAANPNAPEIDVSSPAGVVQTFIAAIHDGEFDDAAALLHPALGCTTASLAGSSVSDSLQLRVERETINDGTATVRLEITEGNPGFLGSGWTHSETYTLSKDGNSWLITGQPWPVYYCEENQK